MTGPPLEEPDLAVERGPATEPAAVASEKDGEPADPRDAFPAVTGPSLEERLAVESDSRAEAAAVAEAELDAPGEDLAPPGTDDEKAVEAEPPAAHEAQELVAEQAGTGEPPAPSVEEPATPARRPFRFGRGEAAPKRDRTQREKRGAHRKAKRLVGLKIGSSQIAAAEVVNNGAPELVEVFREPLEPGLVVSGEIRDPEALTVALKRLFELHKLPKRGVRLGLANNRIGVRIFEIEGVEDARQLDNAIRFRAEEVLPIPLDQAVLDYVVLDEAVRGDGTPWKRILLVVAYREVVDRYLQACRSAGLEVVGIDLEAFALLRAVEPPSDRSQDAGALVAVAIGHDRTTIAVSTGRYCEFTRVLDWGGWSLNVAIARELDRAPSEVESVKRQLSFARPGEVEGCSAEQVVKARDAIQRSLSAFVRELVASLQFYQAQPGALGIGEVVLTGGTAHMDGLPEALGELLGVPIRLGDPFRRLRVGPKVAHEGPRGSLSVAIGLGIED